MSERSSVVGAPLVLANALAFATTFALMTPGGAVWPWVRGWLHASSQGLFAPFANVGLSMAGTFALLVWALRHAALTLVRSTSGPASSHTHLALAAGLALGLIGACCATVADQAVQFASGKRFHAPVTPDSLAVVTGVFFLVVVFSAVVESGLVGLMFRAYERRLGAIRARTVVASALLIGVLHALTTPLWSLPAIVILFTCFNAAWPWCRSRGLSPQWATISMILAHFVANAVGLVRSFVPFLSTPAPL